VLLGLFSVYLLRPLWNGVSTHIDMATWDLILTLTGCPAHRVSDKSLGVRLEISDLGFQPDPSIYSMGIHQLVYGSSLRIRCILWALGGC
jgi:hypothetical protein